MQYSDTKSWKAQPVKDLEKFLLENPETRVVDSFMQNWEELFLLRNPKYRFDKDYTTPLAAFQKDHENEGNWFYFPWLRTIVGYLPDAHHQELRTGRNRYLITKDEQEIYYDAVIGVLGMSVGSHVALTIAMTGGARHIKIADPDTLSGDNLNRIRTGYHNVGTKKVIAVAREIALMNPYAEVEVFENGLTEANTEEFLKGLSVLVEEMDNPYLKVAVRYTAREMKIPIVMAADNGDGIIADIERFDIDPAYPILHGLLGDMKPEDLKKVAPQDLPRVMAKIAGANIAHVRMLESVVEVGKSIYSWPQLGTAATMCGSVLAYLVRRVALRDPKIVSGRFEVNPDSVFEKDYMSEAEQKNRAEKRGGILQKMRLQ